MSTRPPRRRVSAIAVVAVVVLGVGACSEEGDDGVTSATLRTAPTTTSTTVGVDQVPAEITVEYLQRVVDELDASWGAMFRQYKADGGPTPDNLAWLAWLYEEPELSRIQRDLGLAAGDRFEGVVDEPGDPNTTVDEIVRTASSCVLVKVRRSFGSIFVGDDSSEDSGSEYLGLERRPGDEEAPGRNATAWKMTLDAWDDTVPESSCA